MTIIRLPDEALPAFPDRFVSAFYSTRPFDAQGFIKEVGGLDAIILRQISFLEGLGQLQSGEEVAVGDIILVNPNHALHPEASVAERPRQQYVIAQKFDEGYKLRQMASTILFEYDVPELFKH